MSSSKRRNFYFYMWFLLNLFSSHIYEFKKLKSISFNCFSEEEKKKAQVGCGTSYSNMGFKMVIY